MEKESQLFNSYYGYCNEKLGTVEIKCLFLSNEF